MDDLNSKLNEILNDPSAMQQIKELGNMLGISKNTQNNMPSVHNNVDNAAPATVSVPPPAPKPPVQSMPDLSMMSGLGSLVNNDSLKMITKLAPLLASFKQEDDTTRLLNAIRPFLSPERKRKLDEANKILKIMRLMPMIKDFGLFDSIF